MTRTRPRFPAGDGHEQPGIDPLSGEVTVYEPPALEESDGEFPPGANRDLGRAPKEERLRWFNSEADAGYLREQTKETDVGSLKIPAGRSGWIEFHLDAPKGMALKATCNGCWETWYIAPFDEAIECPFCRAGRHKAGIATTEVMDGE